MCGRYSQTQPLRKVLPLFGVEPQEAPADASPRYNIAPTQSVPVVRASEAERHFAELRWGLIPLWAKDRAIGNRLINARAETVADKPAFRAAFRQRRCLVLADGFYEWRREGNRKQPYYFRRPHGEPFAFAGLWERWHSPEGELIETCALITTAANERVRPIHERMPVILTGEDCALWLAPAQNPLLLERLLAPSAPELLDCYPVSSAVNRPGNDAPELIAPLPAQD